MYLTKVEEKTFDQLRSKRDKILMPISCFLDKRNVKPIYLSWLGLLSMVAFGYLIINHSSWAWLFLILSFGFDCLDGSLARFQGKSDMFGFWADLLIDYLGFFMIVFLMIWYGLLIGYWGWIYLVNYIVLFSIAAEVFLHHKKALTVFRTKYYFFAVYFIDFTFKSNLMGPFLVLFGVYMLVMNLFNLLILSRVWKI